MITCPTVLVLVQKMFHELAQEFIQRGHDVTVITPGTGMQEEISFDTFQG